MNKLDVLIGLQWGDEGKGKIVDVLAPRYEIIARFQGGPNAGHTLSFNGNKYILHQIPSGIFRSQVRNLIGNGVALDPLVFRQETEDLITQGVQAKDNLYISKKAVLVLPTHRLIDNALELAKGSKKIGSTLKGIGPSYQDKISRQGLRVGDILTADFESKLESLLAIHFDILDRHKYSYHPQSLLHSFREAVDYLRSFSLIDSEYFINEELSKGTKILAEGAQGTLLDIDFGTYPYVTSSNTISSGACVGLGVSPSQIGQVYGIFKTYSTRVGNGPFPTEFTDELGDKIRQYGNEYGSTTGRPRRCGWIDLPSLKYAVMLSGVTQLIMMKTDVLDHLSTIRLCTHYTLPDGTVTDSLPFDMNADIVPVYKEVKGWERSTQGISVEQMPKELKNYISILENELRVPIVLISTGPDRDQIIFKPDSLKTP